MLEKGSQEGGRFGRGLAWCTRTKGKVERRRERNHMPVLGKGAFYGGGEAKKVHLLGDMEETRSAAKRERKKRPR